MSCQKNTYLYLTEKVCSFTCSDRITLNAY